MNKRFAALLILVCLPVFLFPGCTENPDISAPVSEPSAGQPDVSPTPPPIPALAPSPAPSEDNDPYGGMTYEEIRDLVEGRYGVTVIWGGEEIYTETGPPWEEAPCSDPDLRRRFMMIMDEQLALYPEGFFRQMPETYFILAECIRRPDGQVVQGFADYKGQGRADYKGDYAAIYVTASSGTLKTLDWYHEGDVVGIAGIDFQTVLHHEIGHAVFSMTLDGETFDFDRYYALLPDGFVPTLNVYDLEYRKYIPEDNVEEVYFCSLYAMTNPMEFMAELFCLSMQPPLNWTFASPHVQGQLNNFYAAVREAYDTAGWPEQTYWERALR